MIKKHFPLMILFLIFILVVFLKLMVLDFYQIQGNSMEPNLHIGQIIIINRAAYGLMVPIINKYFLHWAKPKKGEILTVRDPREDKILVKRCVAEAGDQWKIEGGCLITGKCAYPLTRYSYLLLEKSATVPKNHVLVVGDNYNESIDSRTFGFIKYMDILGRVIEDSHVPCD